MAVCFRSVHPFSTTYWVRILRGAIWAEMSRSFSPWPLPPALLGGHWNVPILAERHNLPGVSWVCSRFSSWLDIPKTPRLGGTQRHPGQMPKPPQQAPFNAKEQWPYSKSLLDDWAPHPTSKGRAQTTSQEVRFCCLYLQSHLFGYYVPLVGKGEGGNVLDQPDWLPNHL